MKKKTTYLATLILFALGLMSACTPGELDGDDNSNPDATPVPLAATVSLPATGTVTRANATTGSIKFDVSGSSFTLRRYDQAPDGTTTLTASADYEIADRNDNTSGSGTSSQYFKLKTSTGTSANTHIPVIPTEQADLRIEETAAPVLMNVPADISGTSGTADDATTNVYVPFRTRMKYGAEVPANPDVSIPSATDKERTGITLSADKKAGIATINPVYTTAALRLVLKLYNAGQGTVVNYASCPLTMTGDSPTTQYTPTVTHGTQATPGTDPGSIIYTDATATRQYTAVSQQIVIFGELTPGTNTNGSSTGTNRLTPGSTCVAVLTTSTGELLSVTWPTSATINTVPQPGKMLTLTVHVKGDMAYIAPNVITISGFEDGNGEGGETAGGSPGIASGLTELNPDIFCIANPMWVVTGGGTEATSSSNTDSKDVTVLKNVRTALNKIYTPDNDSYTGPNYIDLMLTDVTTLPTYNNDGAFQSYKQLRNIELPTVTDIEEYAFYKCESLTTASMPSAKAIRKNAFIGCQALTNLDISGVTQIWNLGTSEQNYLLSAFGSDAYPNCDLVLNSALEQYCYAADGTSQNGPLVKLKIEGHDSSGSPYSYTITFRSITFK